MPRIEVGIPTRNRTGCVCILLQALRTQTFTDWDLTVVDDNDAPLLREDATFCKMLWLLEMQGHRYRVVRGLRAGPPFAHNIILMAADHPIVVRIDDDLIPEPTFLEELVDTHAELSKMRDIAAVGGVYPSITSGRMADHVMTREREAEGARYGVLEGHRQLFLHANDRPQQVPALYSSFLYNRQAMEDAGGFPIEYSRIAEKEETDASLRLLVRNQSLVFAPRAVAWHLAAPAGGIRMSAAERQPLFESDIARFGARFAAIHAAEFDWAAEREKNLSAFAKYRACRGQPTGFYCYEDQSWPSSST